MRSREVVEQSGGVVEIGGRDGDVDDPARAVEGFLEGVQAAVLDGDLLGPPHTTQSTCQNFASCPDDNDDTHADSCSRCLLLSGDWCPA